MQDDFRNDGLVRSVRAGGRIAALVIAASVALACAAPASVATPGSIASSGTAATSAPTSLAASPPVATVPATNTPSKSGPIVDLTFTGDFPLVAKGSAGSCQLGHGADGSVIGFGFIASETDFPGLGASFNITEDIGSHQFSVKWVFGDTFIAGVFPSGVTVSPDHKSVTIDADLPAGLGRTEHLKGSIACP